MKKNINLDWKSLNIDYVVESTGKYKTFDELNSYYSWSKEVILSAPSEVDSIKLLYLGKRRHFRRSETIISNASCTTNNAAMIKVINDLCGIEQLI
jgi:glyceraldehyde 3-phosphate dehydrogenase